MHISPYTLHTTLHFSTHPVSHNALVCSLTANAQSLHMPHFRTHIAIHQLLRCTSKYKQPGDTTHTILIKGAHIHALLTLTHFSHEVPSTRQTKLHLLGGLITYRTVEIFTCAHKPALCGSQVVLTWFSSASCFLSFLKVSISFSSRVRTFVYNLLK